ncbi:MAG TPA: amidohydrolase family protein [Candidatus Sulfotelmatobacter sp.]|nr:amidohydrolase family protein [Candidatus Sulfotelmatobacter sp.]
MRKVDLHCYPGTQPWIDSYGPFAEALGAYWKRAWVAKTEEDVIGEFRAAGVEAVLVAFDIESVTGAPPCTNDYVAGMRDRHPDTVLQAWAAVDPLRLEGALVEARHAIDDLGMLGFHFHPIMGRYSVDDPRFTPLFELIAGLNVPVMVDVGTTGMGAGLPGGLGSKLRHAHPLAIDELASNFPDLTIIAAHPGWPWVEEMTAVVLHKGNVYWELSGWAPKYFPESLKKDVRGRLRDKVMFGSDYPSLPYDRILREWEELGYPDEIMEAVFHKNAERVLPLARERQHESHPPRSGAR